MKEKKNKKNKKGKKTNDPNLDKKITDRYRYERGQISWVIA